ncbi:MAG: hypothetical protein G01um101438_533 [Parcubacteria group bacterium Gr01-1014_38]|nr:MAG: hypothetical protein G01um101438_533 [Parcubacteria group bacterium Gr01-1014_38]
MAARHTLYFDLKQRKFVPHEEARRIVRQAVEEENLDIMTDRFVEYGFPPNDDTPEIMKIKVKVGNPMTDTPASVLYLYYSRQRGDFVSEDEARQLLLDAIQSGNLHLVTDRTHEYGFFPDDGNLRGVRIVRICTIVG